MRDPNLNMDRNAHGKDQVETQDAEPRKSQTKTARVAFGTQLETYIPSAATSPPSASTGHQRSLTGLDKTQSGESSTSGGDIVPPESRRSPLASDLAPTNRRSTPALLRTKSDYGPRLGLDRATSGDEDEAFHIRHGWQEEYTSNEYLKILHSVSALPYPYIF